MKKMCWMVCIVGVLLTAGFVSTLSARTGQTGGVGGFAIYVSPDMISTSAQCTWVTIHTDVDESAVDVNSVSVTVGGNDVDVADTYFDDCGNLVVKLRFAKVVAVLGEQTKATITLTVDGLSATAEVRVKD